MLEIILPAEIERRLDAAAKRAGTSASDLARDAILERLDDLEDVVSAGRALEDISAGRSATFSLDEVERRLELGIEFGSAAEKELGALDRTTARRIIEFLRTRVATSDDPRRLAKRLTGHWLGELWRSRVGYYRIVAAIETDVYRVLVVRIGHRSRVYE